MFSMEILIRPYLSYFLKVIEKNIYLKLDCLEMTKDTFFVDLWGKNKENLNLSFFPLSNL